MITITVSGKPGEGKSTIAMLIANQLSAMGFSDITVDDADAHFTKLYSDDLVNGIKERPVLIQTHQLRRNESHFPNPQDSWVGC